MQPAWPQHRHTEFVWDCDAERSKGLTTVLPQFCSKVCFVHLFYLLDIFGKSETFLIILKNISKIKKIYIIKYI